MYKKESNKKIVSFFVNICMMKFIEANKDVTIMVYKEVNVCEV